MTPLIKDAARRGAGPYVRRFSLLERVLHALVIVSFIALVATGIPLKYSFSPWARVLMDLEGGRIAAGLIHRFCAIITFGYFFTHVGVLAYRVARSDKKLSFFWGPDSMVPQPKDLFDFFAMFKWFLGLAPKPPKFDRFSYMEKFDYWGVFWGVAIIGSSGLLLWFPQFFAQLLPGWVFNVATVIHSDEALLALGFIFTVHFFNVHLRPGKFPIDTVIFTGQATAEYMEEEHPLEMERAQQEGTLQPRMETQKPAVLHVWSIILGFLALGLGILMIVLVVLGLLR